MVREFCKNAQFLQGKSPETLQKLSISTNFIHQEIRYNFNTHAVVILSQPAFTCSMLTIETLEQRYEICSKLTTKKPKRHQWRHSDAFMVNFEHISQLALVPLLLTLNI